jgi:cardiolipin synthase
MMNVPNLITIARILLVPFTVWLILSEAYGFAFLAFAIAGISDGVDGYIARRYELRSELGAYLDPLADKALLVSIYITLGFLKFLPPWLVILVVTRDVMIVSAFLLSWMMAKPVKVAPHMVSKVNTVGQLVLIVAVLGTLEFELSLEPFLSIGMAAVAALTVASGAIYLAEWMHHMANGGTTRQ